MKYSAARLSQFVLTCLLSIILLCINILGQTPAPQPSPMPSQAPQPVAAPSPPAANPTDVGSIDAILTAVYEVISGPAGKKRDWDRMRSLFIPGARLIPTGPRPSNSYGARVLTVEDYVTRGTTLFEREGFYEKEVARRTELFGQIAHVFSTYEARHSQDDPKPFIRGINSVQLMNDGKRWWIVTIFWQAEDEQNSLPEKYLPGQ